MRLGRGHNSLYILGKQFDDAGEEIQGMMFFSEFSSELHFLGLPYIGDILVQ